MIEKFIPEKLRKAQPGRIIRPALLTGVLLLSGCDSKEKINMRPGPEFNSENYRYRSLIIDSRAAAGYIYTHKEPYIETDSTGIVTGTIETSEGLCEPATSAPKEFELFCGGSKLQKAKKRENVLRFICEDRRPSEPPNTSNKAPICRP